MSYHRRLFLTCDAPGCDNVVVGPVMPPGVERHTIGELRRVAVHDGWVMRRIPPPASTVVDYCAAHATSAR